MSDITLLDGGMGQELIKRSAMAPSPLWSAQVLLDEPEIVAAVHREYIKAGAQVLTLNSYSATPERLARDASVELFQPLQEKAIEVALDARGDSDVQIAGCLPPLYASYRPDVAPDYETCLDTYHQIVACQKASVDLFLCETMSSVKEAKAATIAGKSSGKPVWCALSVDDRNGMLLRSGEPLESGIGAATGAGADAILINCSLPEAISRAMPVLAKCGLPFGAYANGFTKIDALEPGGTVKDLVSRSDLDPSTYADFCGEWIALGATIIGGCCEVGPDHLLEGIRDPEALAGDGLEGLVVELGDVEVAQHDDVLVHDTVLLAALVDPVREHLQLPRAALLAAGRVPADVGRQQDEVEVA